MIGKPYFLYWSFGWSQQWRCGILRSTIVFSRYSCVSEAGCSKVVPHGDRSGIHLLYSTLSRTFHFQKVSILYYKSAITSQNIENLRAIEGTSILEKDNWSISMMELHNGWEEWGWSEPDPLLKIQWWDVGLVFNSFTEALRHDESIKLYPPQNQEAGSPQG